MASNVFNTGKIYKTVLWGHSFTDFPGSAGNSPELPGTFAADTRETTGQPGGVNEFAIFTVGRPSGNEYPEAWAGTYCLPYAKLLECPPQIIGDVPQPDPDPDPDDNGGDDDPPGDDTQASGSDATGDSGTTTGSDNANDSGATGDGENTGGSGGSDTTGNDDPPADQSAQGEG